MRLNYELMFRKSTCARSSCKQITVCVGLLLLISTNHDLFKLSRRHKFIFLEQISNGGCRCVVWCDGNHVLECFKIKNLKYREALEKLVNDKDVLLIWIMNHESFSSLHQWLLTANVKEITFYVHSRCNFNPKFANTRCKISKTIMSSADFFWWIPKQQCVWHLMTFPI